MKKALDGLRIIDLTRVVSGPYCSAILADLGADVIKIEGHGTAGDVLRNDTININGVSALFMGLNRGKRSLSLDLKCEDGKKILKKLVAKSDVVLENFRPGVLSRLGLDYVNLKTENPKIILASISGFGKGSPLESAPCYDIIAQAYGGLMSGTGESDGEPIRVGSAIGDTSASLYMAISILAAIHARNIHGEGQHIDVSMVDSIFSLNEFQLYSYFSRGEAPPRGGREDANVFPYGPFRAGTGRFILAAYDDNTFRKLCACMDRPKLVDDARFNNVGNRSINRDQLRKIIEGWASDYDADVVVKKLLAEGAPASPIYHVDQVVKSEHIKSRKMLVDVEHPVAGMTQLPAFPGKMSITPATIDRHAPGFGEHNREILSEILGYNEDEITNFQEKNIL